MSKLIHSFKWMISVNILRKIVSFLLFLYIVNIFSRAEIGAFREFSSILMTVAFLSVFSFNYLNIVFRTKLYFTQGLQFLIFSSAAVAIVLFLLKKQFSIQYHSEDIYTYFQYGFWLVIPISINIFIKSLHQLDMNFKLISIAEAVNIVLCSVLSFIFFLFAQKFYMYIVAFYIGIVVELCILAFPMRKKLMVGLYNSLKLKYVKSSLLLIKEKFAFLSINSTSTFINALFSEAPILLLGLFYAPGYMGNYFIASQLVLAPLSLLVTTLSQVLFPAFSLTLREDLPMKIEKYFKHIIYLLWIPIVFGGILLKNWGYLVIGDNDIPLINAIITIVIAKHLFVVIMNPLSTMMTVLKKPQYELYWSLCSIAVICGSIAIFKEIGFLKLVCINAVITIFSLIIFLIIIIKMLKMSVNSFLFMIIKGVFYTLPLLIVLIFINFERNIFAVVLPILTLLVSLSLLYFFERKFIQEVKNEVKNDFHVNHAF